MKMVSAFLVSFFALLTPIVFAEVGVPQTQNTLVEYYKGNQIFGNELAIFQDGQFEIKERTCCPPSTAATHKGIIPPKDLAWLNSLSLKLKTQKLTQSETGGALGEMYGRIIIDGNLVLKHEDQEFLKIDSPEAEALLAYLRKNFDLKYAW